jgi:hypothetical protein
MVWYLRPFLTVRELRTVFRFFSPKSTLTVRDLRKKPNFLRTSSFQKLSSEKMGQISQNSTAEPYVQQLLDLTPQINSHTTPPINKTYFIFIKYLDPSTQVHCVSRTSSLEVVHYAHKSRSLHRLLFLSGEASL